ncbi:hypothetical protein H0E84_04225 [Luteimonas sp. SJ-92]|uniref:Toxin-antitoxin system YwqK family antitoxin n=1 Tax=Luteimonas salinisoli TaxID=2752307 RepID=A0A853JA79_9GAMM|nr:hypothetical protein [Luteimonas salinisoli]
MLIALAMGSAVCAATDERIALDRDYRPIAADAEAEAEFHLEPLVPTDGGWRVRVRYPDGALRLEATYGTSEFEGGHPVGDYTEYHLDGTVRETGRYDAEGRRDGEVRRYAGDGTLLYVGRFRHGCRHGLQEMFYDNGQLRQSMRYDGGAIVDGQVRSYHPQGRLAGVRPYRDGKVHGVAESYHPDGRVSRRSHFVQGRLHGREERFYEDGTVNRRVDHVDGKRHGQSLLFTAEGRLVEKAVYRHDELHGVLTRYGSAGGITEQGSYETGTPVGVHRTWHDDGQPKSVREFDDAGKAVDERRFDAAGLLRSRKRRVETPHGPGWREERWSDGRLLRSFEYDEGRDWALREEFDADGGLRSRSERLDGRQQGEHRVERWDGAVEITHYVDGKRHGEHVVRKDGELLVQGEYRDDRAVGRWRSEEDGVVATMRYDERGRLQGERRAETPDGTILLREHYRDDELHGPYESYRIDGDGDAVVLVSRGRYRDGRRTGPWVVGDDRLGTRAEGRYEDGLRVGPWRTLDAHGYVLRITPFGPDGEPHGRSYAFKEDGALEFHEEVRQGELHGETVFYTDGAPTHRVRYEHGERVDAGSRLEVDVDR